MSDEAVAQVPLSVLRQLSSAAAEMGISLPGSTQFAPTIDVSQPMRQLALELGRLVARQSIYLKAESIITVDEKTGETEVMSPARFVGWVEEYCAFRSSGRSQRARDSLSREDSAIILQQDIFRTCLRPLDAVHTVRLPVRRKDGTVAFLEPGYDTESRILTVDVLPYDMDWTIDRASEFLRDVCSEVPWNGLEEDPERDLLKNRSFSVHVFAMLGMYCRSMFSPETLRPMMAYFANKPGTGKTRMAEMAIAAVFGSPAATGAPKDEEKMDVKLETIARALKPYVLFDDIGGSLRSNSLNRFITEPRHAGRCFNSNSEMFDVPNVTQVFVTANELPTSEDIGRRALIAELFLAEEVRGRKFKRRLTSPWLALPETRKQFLASLCAIVRHWINNDWVGPTFVHPTPLETFEEYTAVVGGMVVAAGFSDPLSRPEMDVGGAGQEDEIKRLLIAAASTYEADCVITRAELVSVARTHGLLEDLVGAEGANDLDESATKKFGRRMQRWRGQRLMDHRGRAFQFSHKKKKSGATYPLAFLK